MTTALRELIAPVTFAHERLLPVSADLAALLPEPGLVRGRVLSCRGSASTSVALSLLAPAVTAGSWLVAVDVPELGLDAMHELGVPLERVVAVRAGAQWAEAMVAAADGFELLLTRVPRSVRPGPARSVAQRLQRHGAVVVVLGDPGNLPCDATFDSSSRWEGIGHGFGYLARRSVEVTSSGRRIHDGRRRELQLAG